MHNKIENLTIVRQTINFLQQMPVSLYCDISTSLKSILKNMDNLFVRNNLLPKSSTIIKYLL